jgi:hypothetical protein
MKYLFLAIGLTTSFLVSSAHADVNVCTLASGSDALQSFVLVRGKNVLFINGIRMRDLYPQGQDGIYYSPQLRDYNFTVTQYSDGPTVRVLKRDNNRAIYHCTPAEQQQ